MKKRIIAAVTAAALTLPAVCAPVYSFTPFNLTAAAEDVQKVVTEGALTFEIYSDHAEVAECEEGVTEVVIPEEIEGVPVTVIQNSAFSYCDALIEIKGGNGITTVNPYAFKGCAWLNNAKLNGTQLILGTVLINAGGIAGMYTVPEGITSLYSEAFSNICNYYKTEEGKISFYYNDVEDELAIRKISSVVLPEGFERIDSAAFGEIIALSSSPRERSGGLYIPKSVSFIDTPVLDSLSNIWYEGTEEEWNSIKKDGKVSADINIQFDVEKMPDSSEQYSFRYDKVGLRFNEVHSIVSDDTFRYGVFSDHVILAGAVNNDISGELVLPSEYDGKPVTSIYFNAFEKTALTSVTIPDTVTCIGESAFNLCDQLTEVKGGDNVEFFTGYYTAFQNTPWIENIINSGLPATLGKVLISPGCVVGRYTVPEGIASVQATAFDKPNNQEPLYSVMINSLELPDGFKYIDGDAFAYLGRPFSSKETSIYIPRSVEYINADCINGRRREIVNTIWYEGTEEEWDAIPKTGELSDKTEVIFNVEKMPISDEAGILRFQGNNLPTNEAHYPDSDENFRYAVFSDHVMLVGPVDSEISGELVIPSEFDGKPVTEIYDNAFVKTEITSVTIPDSVTRIGASAFACTPLTEVKGGKNVSRVLSSEHSNAGVLHATLWIKEIIENNEAAVLGHTLLHVGSCEKGGDYVFPEGITAIDQCAFYNYSFSSGFHSPAPASVTFPEGLKEIPIELLPNSVKDVYIPVSVEAIYRNAFKFSDKEDVGTKDIWYAGTEEQWNAIYNELKIPDGVTVHFGAEGIPAKEETQTTPGDANNDGKVNVADAVAVLQFIANKEKYPLDENGKANADCDGITGITGSDAIHIQKIDAGVI